MTARHTKQRDGKAVIVDSLNDFFESISELMANLLIKPRSYEEELNEPLGREEEDVFV